MLNHNLFDNISSLIRCEWPQWNIQTALLPVKILNLKKNSNNESFIMSSPMKNKCEIKKKRKITAWGPWSKCLDNSCDTDLAIKIRRYEYFKTLKACIHTWQMEMTLRLLSWGCIKIFYYLLCLRACLLWHQYFFVQKHLASRLK